MPVTPQRRRIAIFLLVCAGGVAVLAGYIQLVHRPRLAESGQVAEQGVTASPAVFAAYSGRPHVVFVNTSLDQYNDRLAVLALGETGLRFVGDLRCERVHVGAGVG